MNAQTQRLLSISDRMEVIKYNDFDDFKMIDVSPRIFSNADNRKISPAGVQNVKSLTTISYPNLYHFWISDDGLHITFYDSGYSVKYVKLTEPFDMVEFANAKPTISSTSVDSYRDSFFSLDGKHLYGANLSQVDSLIHFEMTTPYDVKNMVEQDRIQLPFTCQTSINYRFFDNGNKLFCNEHILNLPEPNVLNSSTDLSSFDVINYYGFDIANVGKVGGHPLIRDNKLLYIIRDWTNVHDSQRHYLVIQDLTSPTIPVTQLLFWEGLDVNGAQSNFYYLDTITSDFRTFISSRTNDIRVYKYLGPLGDFPDSETPSLYPVNRDYRVIVRKETL